MSRRFAWVRRRVEPIGLDLGARCIRMLQLTRDRGQLAVVAAAHRVLPAGITSDTEYERFAINAVSDMMSEGFVGRDVITQLGWEQMQIRSLRVPSMPEAEIGDVIRFEAAERFGLDPDEAELRFLVAGDVRQGTEIRQEVIVFGARRSDIDAHIRFLSRMGQRPAAIDAGPCAAFRGFERFLRRDEDRGSVNAFLDLGYRAGRLVVSRGPEIIFFKSIPIGGARFDELVSEQLDMSLAEAADLRVRLHRRHIATLTGQPLDEEPVGENVQRAMLDAIRPALEQLSREIGLCLRYCSVTFRGLRADEVTVVGGEAFNNDVLRLLSDHLSMPLRLGKPLRNVGAEIDFGGADRRTGQPEWATVFGLALKPTGEALEAAA